MNDLFERFLQRVTIHLQRYCPAEYRSFARREIYRITKVLFDEKPKKSELEVMNEVVHYLHDAFPEGVDALYKMERLCERVAKNSENT